jgi:tetratricopeptide (TPR) repeat protein
MKKGLKRYDENFLKAVDRALSMKASQRPQSVQEFQKDIAGEITHIEEKKSLNPAESGKTASKNSKTPLIVGAMVLLVAGLAAFFILESKSTKQVQHLTQPSTSETADTSKSNVCKENGLEGCYKIAYHYAKNGSSKKAAIYFKKACDNKDARGCTALGIYYHTGKGVEKNVAKAKEFFAQACKEKNSEGCYNLALMYAKEQDHAKAISLYEKACLGGYGKACLKLGKSYYTGHQVGKDIAKAKLYYGKACEAGVVEGCTVAGVLYAKEKDYVKAKQYFMKGCSGNREKSCYNLGLLYDKGRGVALDKAKAKEFFNQACKNGYEKACKKLKNSGTTLEVFKKMKQTIDSQLKSFVSETFAKCYNSVGLTPVFDGNFPQNTEKSYSIFRDKQGIVRYITESPVSESGDWFVSFDYYYDSEGNLFAFSLDKSMFSACSDVNIVYEKKITYYDKVFNIIGKSISVEDDKKNKLNSKYCNLDQLNFKTTVIQNSREYLRSIGYSL